MSDFTLPPLPYAVDALQPHMSAETLNVHHGKHHQTYVTNLNNLLRDDKDASRDLPTLIRNTHGKPDQVAVFNNAAQIWNHDFFWKSMKPNGGGRPADKVMIAIDVSFGGFAKFAEQFKAAALGQFGSGWAWLVREENGKLAIVKTSNAETPLTSSAKPLLTVDVWEHAYYIDFRNRRADFVDVFLNNLVNWDFAAANLKAA